MSTYISLKEARQRLSIAADMFTPAVKLALDLWLSIVEELPRHAQNLCTAAATQLVQAALQQAPRPIQPGEARNVAWLQKHLPGISTAMQDCMNSLMEITARRTSILQSLATTKQQVSDDRMQTRVEAERDMCVHLDTLSLVLHHISPIAALCSDMQWPSKGDQQKAGSHHEKQQQRLRLQQGNELIRRVACSLHEIAGVKGQHTRKKPGIDSVLEGLGAPVTGASDGLYFHYHTAHYMLCRTSIIWLALVTALPADHSGTAQFLNQVYWPMLQMPHNLLSQSERKLAKGFLFRIIRHTQLLQQYPEAMHNQIAPYLLDFMQISAETMERAGVPREQVQRLQSWLVSTDAVDNPDVNQGSGSYTDQDTGSQRPASAGSSSRDVDGHQAAAADSTDSQTPDAQDDLDDMKALLRLMYGCTV